MEHEKAVRLHEAVRVFTGTRAEQVKAAVMNKGVDNVWFNFKFADQAARIRFRLEERCGEFCLVSAIQIFEAEWCAVAPEE